jgi:hypothetical protein
MCWQTFVRATAQAHGTTMQVGVDVSSQAGDLALRATGSTVAFPGFLAVWDAGSSSSAADDSGTAAADEAGADADNDGGGGGDGGSTAAVAAVISSLKARKQCPPRLCGSLWSCCSRCRPVRTHVPERNARGLPCTCCRVSNARLWLLCPRSRRRWLR